MQVTFKSHAFTNGFRMVVVGEEEPITGCITERLRGVTSTNVITSTCHAGTIVHLRANQALAIATLNDYYRPMMMEKHLTYWGLYRVN